jgi:hypothetical protein
MGARGFAEQRAGYKYFILQIFPHGAPLRCARACGSEEGIVFDLYAALKGRSSTNNLYADINWPLFDSGERSAISNQHSVKTPCALA